MATTDLNRRAALHLLVAGGSAALLAGCGGTRGAPSSGLGTDAANGGNGAISVTDQRGKTLTFARPVTRVVTIPMPAASLLVAVDRTADHLTAMHNASWVAMRDGIMGTIFPKALELPHEIATQDFNANVESVRALDPDVVIQWSDSQLTDPLEKAGLNIIGLTNTGKQEDVDAWVAIFAAMLGKPQRAVDIKARSDLELAAVKRLAATRGATGPSILYFNRFTGGLKVAAANSYNDFYIKLVGGTNPATGNDPLKGSGMVGLDVEQVLRWNPEIILLGNFDNAMPQDLYSDPVWQTVSAVRNRRVYKVPLGGYRWDPPGQESPLMWHWLSDIAFPQQQSFLRNKVVEYFDFLYGHKPTAAELDKILWTKANSGSDHYGQLMLHDASDERLDAGSARPSGSASLHAATAAEAHDGGRHGGRAAGEPDGGRRGRPALKPIAVGTALLVAVTLVALAVGRYNVPLWHVVQILVGQVLPIPAEATATEENVVLLVRLPRILLALLVGGGLAIGGAALQAIFHNPLVSPDIIGVSAGASFGGALAFLLGLGTFALVTGSFAFGLVALATLFLITSGRGGTPLLMIVLGGVVTGSFFSALVALVTYIADPNTTLPAIVFWLLGSVATATFAKVAVALIPIAGGAVVLLALRWRINVLSLGDDDAAALGIRPRPLRWTVLVSVALIVAGAVAVSGVVSWVGLVIPHLARMWVGPDHRVLLPVSFLLGGAYIMLVDTVARTVTAGEIPLGVLTALIGAPVFFVLLRRNRDRIWESA